jgi:hypothetical protein
MKTHTPKQGLAGAILILVSILSILSVSATYVIANQTLFLPLILQPGSSATPTQVGTPPPPETLELVVNPSNPDKDWALAFFAKSYNNAGRPVMQIYPRDTAPDSERIKIPRGEIVLALKDIVTADGGAKYWQLVEYQGKDDEDLFLKAADVTKLPPAAPAN